MSFRWTKHQTNTSLVANAESVRQFQPRVALWEPWEHGCLLRKAQTRKGCAGVDWVVVDSNPFWVAISEWSFLNPGFQSKPWARISERFQRYPTSDQRVVQAGGHCGRFHLLGARRSARISMFKIRQPFLSVSHRIQTFTAALNHQPIQITATQKGQYPKDHLRCATSDLNSDNE